MYTPNGGIQVVGEKGETAEGDVGHVPARYIVSAGGAAVKPNVGSGRRCG